MINHWAVLFAESIFWIGVPLVLFLPARWAVLAYLVLVQIDLSGSANYAMGNVGFENAVKTILLPTILLLKVWPPTSFSESTKKLRLAWFLLAAYAGVSCIWSPYLLPALKMMGYFYAYTVLFLVLTVAWRSEWFSANALMLLVWSYLLLAVMQTYLLGNTFGDPDYDFRFTSFTGSQSFAASLISFVVLLWFCKRHSAGLTLTTLAATLGMLLTGSRSVVLGFVWVLVVGGVFLGAGRGIKIGLMCKRFAIASCTLICLGLFINSLLPKSRLNEALTTAFSPNESLQDVNTFAWRLVIYQRALSDLSDRSMKELLIGSGTSSGANVGVATGFFTDDTVDPNRVVHDEFLRSTYEWGLPGVVLLILFLFFAMKTCIRMVREQSPQAKAFLAISVPILITLLVENILADAASPGGVGYLMVLAAMVAADRAPEVSDISVPTEVTHDISRGEIGEALPET